MLIYLECYEGQKIPFFFNEKKFQVITCLIGKEKPVIKKEICKNKYIKKTNRHSRLRQNVSNNTNTIAILSMSIVLLFVNG